jgi:DNA adenine methylase
MVKRPPLRYHGSKWSLAPWIIQHLPTHRIYVEPYAGGASVLLRKPKSAIEIYNDLDGQIVNLFRVLRDGVRARELLRQMRLTPFSRAEYEESWIVADDPIEQARRLLVRSAMGHGTTAATAGWRTGWRNYHGDQRHAPPSSDWSNLPDALEATIERLRDVMIECRPALAVIEEYDGPDTLFYVDPPYLAETRHERYATAAYRHEMTADDHADLARALSALKGMAVVSGYASAQYDEIYAGWQRVERGARADGGSARTEVLWISPGAIRQPTLLDL